jgi:hypothetical protein
VRLPFVSPVRAMLAFKGRAGQWGKQPLFVDRARFINSGNARRSDALSRWPFRSPD